MLLWCDIARYFHVYRNTMLTRIRIRTKVILFAITASVFMSNFVFLYFLPDIVETNAKDQRYVHPHNTSIKGRKFNLNSRTYTLAMRLLTQLENGKTVQTWSVESLVEAMKPVTAISSDHYKELLKHLDRFHQFIPNKRIIVYDLGLDPDHIYTLKRIEYVEYRQFDFSDYPRHVRNLGSYAWKTLIIQQVMAEHGGALWLDSSVRIRKPYTRVIEQIEKTGCGILFYLSLSGHNIASATHPKMFQYLPMKNTTKSRLEMPQGGGIVIFNTPEVRERIFKWAIFCSLLQDCIAPKGSTTHCYPKFQEESYGGCHRYDQSMYAILATNAFNSRTEEYLIASKLRYAVVSRFDPPLYRQVLVFLKSWFLYLCVNWTPFTCYK